MARKAENKWEKRSTNLMKRLEKQSETTIQELVKIYNKAQDNIQKEIEKIFNQYAKNGSLKKEVAQRLLTKKEQSIYYNNLLKEINTINDEDIKRKLLAKYNAPAYSYRISRYQALQDNITVEMKKLADFEKQITTKRYVNTMQEAYYRNMYEIQHGLSVGFSFAQMDRQTIELMLAENWAGKANYSQRIWGNNNTLTAFLKNDLTASIMSGASVQKIASNLNDTMHTGLYNATRLVRTEVNHFANEAEMLSYEEAGIKEYQFIATLDKVTCKRCAKLDKQIFNVKDRKPGRNYPPIHANDRCTTVAVFDDENTKDLLRRAKDENGKTMLIPLSQNVSYQEWYNEYVDESLFNKKNISKKKEEAIYKDITNQKYNLINTAFKNENIKKIAFNTPIKTIKYGGQKSYHIQGNIVLRNGYINNAVIHEIGHAVDYNNNWLSSSKNFKEAYQKDKQLVLHNKKLYRKLIKNNQDFIGLSDIIGGMTKNKIVGKYKHKINYWKQPNKQERETFTHYFVMAGENDFKQLTIMKRYLPNTFNEFDNIIRRLLE